MRTFNLKTGDTQPLRAQLVYSSTNLPIDLTGATVLLYVEGIVAGGACTLVDEDQGQVQYAWGAGETDVAGDYDAEFKVTIAGVHQRIPSKGTLRVSIAASVV